MLNELHIQLLQWNNYGYPATELNNKKELYQTLIENMMEICLLETIMKIC